MKKAIIDYWKWIFGPILFSLSIKSILSGGFIIFMVVPIIAKFGVESLIKEIIIPSCYTFSSLLLLVSSIGLIMAKNWARKLILSIFPIYFLFSFMLSYYYIHEGDLINSLRWNVLIPVFYITLLYFFTRKNIKEQFK